MFFLGIDPGYARLGFGLIKNSNTQGKPVYVKAGIIETSSEKSDGERLEIIEKSLKNLIHKKNISMCAIEQVFFRKNLTTGIKLIQARGIILLTLHKNKIPIIEITPTSMKKMITGYGKAEKIQLQKMTAQILNLSEIPKPDDAADGLGLALCAWLGFRGRKI
ncbi:MAG: crossover junction endodeoxyribonuclease RuvC [Spirochaetia bacterium]|nr:crossover junction endodeoxyribonuclease RuvC [Spirochaetia bacterium]